MDNYQKNELEKQTLASIEAIVNNSLSLPSGQFTDVHKALGLLYCLAKDGYAKTISSILSALVAPNERLKDAESKLDEVRELLNVRFNDASANEHDLLRSELIANVLNTQ